MNRFLEWLTNMDGMGIGCLYRMIVCLIFLCIVIAVIIKSLMNAA
jgi:tetrahydromethanopterin S-methyltransferase subunit G